MARFSSVSTFVRHHPKNEPNTIAVLRGEGRGVRGLCIVGQSCTLPLGPSEKGKVQLCPTRSSLTPNPSPWPCRMRQKGASEEAKVGHFLPVRGRTSANQSLPQ